MRQQTRPSKEGCSGHPKGDAQALFGQETIRIVLEGVRRRRGATHGGGLHRDRSGRCLEGNRSGTVRRRGGASTGIASVSSLLGR
jgi:hypothetical protein